MVNVMEVVWDDYGSDRDLKFTHAPIPVGELVLTPNLLALYERGVRYTAFRTQPWCSPSRAAALTGRFAFRTGIAQLAEGPNQPLLLNEMCTPRMLKLGMKGGLDTAAFGKWHLSTEANGGPAHPNLVGFDHFAGCMANLDSGNRDYYQWERVVDGVRNRCFEYAPRQTTNDALEWWNSREPGRPKYAKVAYNLPHQPYHRPPLDHYDQTAYTLAGQYPNAGEDSRTYYKAMIQSADFELGRLMAGMKDLGETIVIFWSDNGPAEGTVPDAIANVNGVGSIYPPSGGFSSHAKRTPYDWGIRNPMCVAGPQCARPGRTSPHVVSVVDIYATVAEIMGADLSLAPSKDGRLDSLSFFPGVKDRTLPSVRTFGVSEVFAPNTANANAAAAGQRTIYDAQYTLIRTQTGVTFPQSGDQFYDIVADVNQLVNLTPGGSTASLTAPQLAAYTAQVNYFVPLMATP